MTYIPDAIRILVIERARGCCEYCLIHDEDVFLPHHLDHAIALKHRGKSVEDNLCYSCARCNVNKGSDLSSIDIVTNALTPLYNPRRDRWEDHFRLEGVLIVPLTAVGRVTEFLLELNSPDQLRRRTELPVGRYPCPG